MTLIEHIEGKKVFCRTCVMNASCIHTSLHTDIKLLRRCDTDRTHSRKKVFAQNSGKLKMIAPVKHHTVGEKVRRKWLDTKTEPHSSGNAAADNDVCCGSGRRFVVSVGDAAPQ